MMHKKWLGLLLLGLFIAGAPAWAQGEDGIPDNCEFQYAPHYRPALFPRYEPQNRRLLLVDWNTGTDLAVLATDLGDTVIRGWSASCRYLAVTTSGAAGRQMGVYDTVDARLVGSADLTSSVLNPITWGPGDYLVIEDRAGALLWHVPGGARYTLDVGYSPIISRNFSRLRWDVEQGLLTANFAVGGRAIYELASGRAINLTATRPGEVVFGGQVFACQPTREAQGGARVSGAHLNYARDGGVVYVGWGNESLATLEADVPPTGLRGLGWSINCRYVAGALGSTDRADGYDTVIWDALDGRRVGVFPDARDLPHRLTWDTAEQHVLIETRDGPYLWSLLDDTRVRVNAEVGVEAEPCGWEGCRTYSFARVYWDAGRGQMLGVPVESPDAVVAYDVATGEAVTRYTVEGASAPLDFITSGDSALLVTYADGQMTIWRRADDALLARVPLPAGSNLRYFNFRLRSAISTNNRYLAINGNRTLWVWDLTALGAGAPPTFTYDSLFSYAPVFFLNGDTLGHTYGSGRINVATGERFGAALTLDPQAQPVQAYTPVIGTDGIGGGRSPSASTCQLAARYQRDRRQLIARDLRTDTERVIEADLNRFYSLYLSPDCATIYGQMYLDNDTLPYERILIRPGYDFRRQTELLVWDVASGARIATLDTERNPKRAEPRIQWSPDSRRALFDSGRGIYLIEPGARRVIPVRFQDTEQGYLPGRLNTYWDHGRGVVFVAGYGEVFAIDMQTGVERLRFPALEAGRGGCYVDHSTGCGMSFSADGAWVFVYGNDTLSAWNVDTLANAIVPVDNGRGWDFGAAISPDGRFLIVSRSAVRVWDLANLPEEFAARTPIATYSVGGESVVSLRFVDGQIIEVVTRNREGEQATRRYDVLTGAAL